MRAKDGRAHAKKIQKRLRRRGQEGNLRGDSSQEYVVSCLNYLQGSGRVLKIIESRKNSNLDRRGIDIIVHLPRMLFNNVRDRDCYIDVKSSIWGITKNNNSFILKFIPERTRPIPEEAERLLQEMLAHIQKVDGLLLTKRKE